MSERGVGFSQRDHGRVARVVKAFERGEFDSPSSSPTNRPHRPRTPIRAMILNDIGPGAEEHEWIGDVALSAAIVTEFDDSRCKWLIRPTTLSNVKFVLQQGSDETPDLTDATTPDEMFTHLDALPGLNGYVQKVEGRGDTYGATGFVFTINHPVWWVTLASDWPGRVSGSQAKAPLTVKRGRVICQQTDWRLTSHIEVVYPAFGLRAQERFLQGSLVLATHFPGRGFVVTTPECYRLDD